MKVTNAIAATVLSTLVLTGCTTTAVSNSEVSTNTVVTSEPSGPAEVSLSAGRLIGLKENGVYKFRGVPYATAERFKDPEPVTEYENGVQLAYSYGTVSPQTRTLSANGSRNSNEYMTPSNGTADMVGNENCQNLNVWTTSLDAKKPVIVFFHGGGLTSGAASELSYYNGEYMAENNDVVFVSVNHRLNVLGFLDVSAYGEEYENSGIVGLQDCIEALRWVRDNIEQFGGDPDNVTIVGQSGGGDKVTTLASMDDAAGLFDKAVVMSGYYSTTTQEDGIAETAAMVEKLGLTSENAIETLTTMPYEELLAAASDTVTDLDYARVGTGSFNAPFIDEEGNVNENAKNVTWIIGSTFSEFSDNSNMKIYYQMDGYYLDEIDEEEATSRLTEIYGEYGEQVAEEFKNAYPQKPLSESLFLNRLNSNLWGRIGMTDTENGLLKKMNDAGLTVYSYVSAYTQPFWGGATMFHTSDIPYWFDSIDEAEYLIYGDEENAHKVAKTMSTALASFAADGNPSTESLSWNPYTNDNHETMVFDVTSEARADHDTKLNEIMRTALSQ